MSKALDILQKDKSVSERAGSFIESIKRNLQKKIIDALIEERDKLKDRIFELSDFSLETNLNKGVSATTREEAESKFQQLIEAEYDLKIVELELDYKQELFTKYFGTNDLSQIS